jgi:hypothetical protein
MLYPTRFQVRHSTVLVIVLLLMGSVLYEVTRTESAARQNAARTQDISLPAAQPVEHKIRAIASPDYIGRSSYSAPAASVLTDGAVALGGPVATTATSVRGEAVGGSSDAPGNSGNAPGRVRSASSSGYAAGSYGMGGVGAWGGVSGMVRASAATTAKAIAPAKEKKPAAPKKPAPNRPGSPGGGATAVGTSGPAQLPEAGFSTGAAAVEPGAVAAVHANGNASPAAAPAATPEPMSVLLMGTGLVALYGVRRRFQ